LFYLLVKTERVNQVADANGKVKKGILSNVQRRMQSMMTVLPLMAVGESEDG